MYVCHCNVVTDRDIIESMANGARCIADLARDTGAGRSCGGCVPTLRALVSGPERRASQALSAWDRRRDGQQSPSGDGWNAAAVQPA